MENFKLGFAQVIGIDNDPQAIEVAHENLARNPDLAPLPFQVCSDDLSHPALPQADVVVANIIAEVLCDLKRELLHLLKPGGLLILSGILQERAHTIEATFKELTLLEKKSSPEWCAYLLSPSL